MANVVQDLEAWHADLVFGPTGGAVLDGASFGCSAVLAATSLHLGLPVPSSVAGSAAVNGDGFLLPVDAIAEKLAAVEGSALAVRRFVVAADQRIDRATRTRAREAGIRLVWVETARDLLDHVFGRLLPRAIDRAWSNPSDAGAAARALYDLAMSSRPLISWESVRVTAAQLRDRLRRGSPERRMAHFAYCVAARHGGEAIELPWPTEEESRALARPRRLKHVAHVLQSSTDAGSRHLARRIRLAMALVRPDGECSFEDLELRGAIGRALARRHAFDEAIGLLGRTVQQWIAVGQAHQASYALSELIRLLGVRRKGDSLTQLLDEAAKLVLLHDQTSLLSTAYVKLAAGRALVLNTLPNSAIDHLDGDAFWGSQNLELRLARLRWLARALRESGDMERATTTRTALRGLARRHYSRKATVLDQVLLSDIDFGVDPVAAARRLRENYPESTGFLDHHRRNRAWARALADGYPY